MIIIGYSNICISLLDVQGSCIGCNLNTMFMKKPILMALLISTKLVQSYTGIVTHGLISVAVVN